MAPNYIHRLLGDMPRGIGEYKDRREIQKLPDAAWQNPVDIVTDADMRWSPEKILLGAIDHSLIGILEDRHICTVAGSRAGKGVSCIIPNLLHYKGSVIAIDPKGELASITARRREEMGQKVCVLDPFGKTASWVSHLKASYNPMSFLDVQSETLIEDAGLIAESVVVTNQNANVDPHWDESARNFIEGVILHVATYPKYRNEKTLLTVHKLLGQGVEFKKGKQEEIGVRGLCCEMMDNAEKLEKGGEQYASVVIMGTAVDMYERGENEMGSVMSTVSRHVKFMGYRPIKEVVSGHDFSLSELKTAKDGMTIYLCLPASMMGLCNRWLRMIINLAMVELERQGQGDTATGDDVLFVLDEFAVLGHMRQIEDAAGQIASFHVKLWTILQDLSQLKSLYRDRWETFLGNAGVLQFFGNNDLTTLEFIQKRCGKTAVWTKRQSADHKGIVSDSSGYETHDLITAEEASRFFSRSDKMGRQLVILSGQALMILQRIVYFDDRSPFYKGVFENRYDDLKRYS